MRSQATIQKCNKLFCFILLLLLCHATSAQSRKQLETKRKQLMKDINLTTGLLKETTKNKAATLDRFVALKKQIKKREELVSTLKKEIILTDENIIRTGEVIEALGEDVEQIKEEYGAMIRQAYRHKANNSEILFLFSADNFNQAVKRYRHLQQYDEYRKKQAKLIVATQDMLEDKLAYLEVRKTEKIELLESSNTQKDILKIELKDLDKLLSTLKKDEKRLKKDLKEQEISHKKLDFAIEDIIKSEIAINKKEKQSGSISSEESKEKLILTSDFSSNRGRLPWPVNEGIVTRRFGKQAHPTLHKIEITNNGIDIRTERNAPVKAVFEGTVAGKQFVPGYDNMLIIQHGEYYTVYSNLEQVYVKRGETVTTQQTIGIASVDDKSNKSEVHFEVWRDKTRLNPQDWVSKK